MLNAACTRSVRALILLSRANPAPGRRHPGIATVLQRHAAAVNALDFSKDGELLLSSGDDGRVCLTQAATAAPTRMTNTQELGATHARFTHDPMSVIVASPVEYAQIHHPLAGAAAFYRLPFSFCCGRAAVHFCPLAVGGSPVP